MLFGSIINTVESTLGWILDKIPGINVDLGEFASKLAYLVNLTKSMNYILPIKEALVFTGILLGIKLSMLIFWAAMRVINLLRGAG